MNILDILFSIFSFFVIFGHFEIHHFEDLYIIVAGACEVPAVACGRGKICDVRIQKAGFRRVGVVERDKICMKSLGGADYAS